MTLRTHAGLAAVRVAGAPGLALPGSRVTAPVLATLAASACLLALLAAGSDRGALPAPAESRLEGAIVKAPLAFEPNAGRTDRRVDFMAHSVLGGTLYLGSGQAVLSLPQSSWHNPLGHGRLRGRGSACRGSGALEARRHRQQLHRH